MKRQRQTKYLRLFYCFLLIFSCLSLGRTQESERKVLKKAEVKYPSDLKKRGIAGTVRLRVVVRPDGRVKDIDVLGGSAPLAEAAKISVREWKFEPSDTETSVTVSVKFDPNS